MTSPIIHLKCRGADLSATLAESIATVEEFGSEWTAEIAKARRIWPGAILVHPSALPTDEQIAAMWPVAVRTTWNCMWPSVCNCDECVRCWRCNS